MAHKAKTERRHHTRFKTNHEIIVFYQGGIGRVEEISKNGFSARFTHDNTMSQGDIINAKIFVKGGSDYIKALQGELVWQGKVLSSRLQRFTTQKLGFQFVTPTTSQKMKLETVIQHFSEIERKKNMRMRTKSR